VDDGVDNRTPDPTRAVSVRRRAVAVLINEASALAREGFFLESAALMDAARRLMGAPSMSAEVVPISATRMRREP
jgi:hypothetical protein